MTAVDSLRTQVQYRAAALPQVSKRKKKKTLDGYALTNPFRGYHAAIMEVGKCTSFVPPK